MVATQRGWRSAATLRIAASIASGALYFASFPPLSWTLVAFIAWVPLMLAVHSGETAERPSRLMGGLSTGMLFGLLALSMNPPEVVTGIAWVGVSLSVGLVFGVAGGLAALPLQTPRVHIALRGWAFVWLPAFAWAGVEYLRLVTTAGHPWGITATAQIDVAPLRAFLPLAGMWPVTIIVVATNGAIAALILAARHRWMGSRRALVGSVGTVAAAWVLGTGLALLPPAESTGSLRVAAVQPGEHVPDHPLTGPLIAQRQYAPLTELITSLHDRATSEAALQDALLVVWPEASGWVDPGWTESSRLTSAVAELAIRTGTTIVWPYFIRIDPDRTRNEVVLVNPRGHVSPPTTKAHPVWAIGERSVTSELHPVYVIGESTVGLALGPDGTYTDTFARLARDGAQVIAVPTHDWRAYAGTQVAHLRVRAAEHRLAIVKADWRYGSAVIGPDGRVVAATSENQQLQATLVADVDLTVPGTPYTATGDYLGVVSLAIAAIASAYAAAPVLRLRIRSREDGETV